MPDFYQILGVKPTATATDIQSAFRKLAKQTHPDLNKNDPKKGTQFQQIKEAYDTLSNADKRKAYDQKRQEQLKPKRTTPTARSTSPRLEKPTLSPTEAKFLYKRYKTKRWMRFHLFGFLIFIGLYLILRQIYLPILYPFYPYIGPVFRWILIYKALWIIILFTRLRWITFRFRHHH